MSQSNSEEFNQDPYSGFNDSDPDMDSFLASSHFQDAITRSAAQTGRPSVQPLTAQSSNKAPPTTAGDWINQTRIGFPGSSMVIPTTGWATGIPRPSAGCGSGQAGMSSVKAAGFTVGKESGGFGPVGSKVKVPRGCAVGRGRGKEGEELEERQKRATRSIHEDMDASCMASAEERSGLAVQKAKDALRKFVMMFTDILSWETPSGAPASETNSVTAQQKDAAIELAYAVHFNLGAQYEAGGYYSQALGYYSMLAKKHPYTLPGNLRVCLANVYFKMGDYRRAIKYYKMGLDQVSFASHARHKAKILRNIAISLFHMGRYAEALRKFEEVLTIDSTPLTAFSIVLCSHALGQLDQMKAGFVRLLGSDQRRPYDDDRYVTPGGLDDVKTQEILLEAIKNDELRKMETTRREEMESFVLRSAKLIAGEMGAGFAAGYEWCVEQVSASKFGHLIVSLEIDKAIGFIQRMDYNKAVETLSQFDPTYALVSGTAATNLSFLSCLSNSSDEVAFVFTDLALVADSLNPAAYVNRGNICFRRQEYEAAAMCYEKALSCDASCPEAAYNLGLASKRLGRYEYAIGYFRRLLAMLGNNTAQVIYQLADLFDTVGRRDKAMEWFVQLIGLVPTDPGVLRRMGEIADAAGDTSQAHLYYTDSFRCDPTNVDVINWLGAYYVRSQYAERAIGFFQKGAHVQPNSVHWWMMIAGCHRRNGDIRAAVEAYRTAHRRFPENVDCLRFLVKLCGDLGLRELGEYERKLKRAMRTEKLKRLEEESASVNNSGRSYMEACPDRPISSEAERRNLNRKRHRYSPGTGDGPQIDVDKVQGHYDDPLGPKGPPKRPGTSCRMSAAAGGVDFDDAEIGDDLLPD